MRSIGKEKDNVTNKILHFSTSRKYAIYVVMKTEVTVRKNSKICDTGKVK
jgi:hypothetical protein